MFSAFRDWNCFTNKNWRNFLKLFFSFSYHKGKVSTPCNIPFSFCYMQKSGRNEESMWGASDFSPIQDSTVGTTSTYNWGDPEPGTGDEFFSSLLEDSKPKVIIVYPCYFSTCALFHHTIVSV